jgi:hypothetical protein
MEKSKEFFSVKNVNYPLLILIVPILAEKLAK